jgi:hypothetical protein
VLKKALATLAKQENTWRGALSSESLGNCISGFRGWRAKGTLRRLNGLLDYIAEEFLQGLPPKIGGHKRRESPILLAGFMSGLKP